MIFGRSAAEPMLAISQMMARHMVRCFLEVGARSIGRMVIVSGSSRIIVT